MLIPVRCFSCGSLVSCKYMSYKKKVEQYRKNETETVLDFEKLSKEKSDETPEFKAMRDLDIDRICCRRHMLCNVDLIDVI